MKIVLRLREYRNMDTRIVETLDYDRFLAIPRQREKIMIEGVLYMVSDIVYDYDKDFIVVEAVKESYQEGYKPYKEVKRER